MAQDAEWTAKTTRQVLARRMFGFLAGSPVAALEPSAALRPKRPYFELSLSSTKFGRFAK